MFLSLHHISSTMEDNDHTTPISTFFCSINCEDDEEDKSLHEARGEQTVAESAAPVSASARPTRGDKAFGAARRRSRTPKKGTDAEAPESAPHVAGGTAQS